MELVAIDLDGTLLTSQKTITHRARRVLRALSNLNTKVLLATARPPRSTAGSYKALNLDSCMICYNGALIYNPPTREVWTHHPISISVARNVIQIARGLYAETIVSVEMLDHWFTDRVSSEYQTEVSRQFVPDKLAPIETWLNCDVTKILLLGPESILPTMKCELNRNFCGRLSIIQSDRNLLQVMSNGVSKGQALRFVCEHYNIPLHRTIAIGDASNDIEMLKCAGMGIAMGHASDKVKEAADYVTKGNDEDGVAEALEKFIL